LVAVVAPPQGSTEPIVEEFDAFLAPTFLITHTDRPIPEVEAVLDLLRDDRRLRPGSDGLRFVGPRMGAAGAAVAAERLDERAEVARALATELRPGVHVLLKASRGVGLERALAALRA